MSMIDLFLKHQTGIIKAFWETCFMISCSILITLVVSIPLGVILFGCKKQYLWKNKFLDELLSVSLNALRSVPFLIFIFILIPINRYFFKTGFGNVATILPISLVSISIYTRFVEQALLAVPKNIVDRAISMGATKYQIVYYFLLPYTIQDLILSFASVVISMLSYSTVVGVIGAGGLGNYAYRFGYQEYDYPLMYLIILIFIILVFIIQTLAYVFTKGGKNK